jgi:hypothetical protein
MNTKNIVAILMATIIAMAMFAPTAMAGTTDATLSNTPPYICDKWEEMGGDEVMDPILPGSTPIAVKICACVCDINGNDDIASVTAYTSKGPITLVQDPTVDCSACTCMPPATTLPCEGWSGILTLDPCDPAGPYRIMVIAEDVAGDRDCEENFIEYESSGVLINLVPSQINFGPIEICTPSYFMTTIENTGNEKAIVTVTASDMSAGGIPEKLITAANLDVNRVMGLSAPGVILPKTFKCGVPQDVEFSIHAPVGTKPGTYQGTITLSFAAVTPCKQIYDLGDPTGLENLAEPAAIHMRGWSTELVTFDTGGNYGRATKYQARLVWGPEEQNDGNCAEVDFTDCNDKELQKITIRHLVGMADDSFDVYVGTVRIGSYADCTSNQEVWTETSFYAPVGTCCPVTVKICATGPAWSMHSTYGQLAIDWIEMTCCGTCP